MERIIIEYGGFIRILFALACAKATIATVSDLIGLFTPHRGYIATPVFPPPPIDPLNTPFGSHINYENETEK